MQRNQHSSRIAQQLPWSALEGSYLQLKIQLMNISPPIWRRIIVHKDIDLNRLNMAIQAVMGWQGLHLFDFYINDHFYGPEELAKAQRYVRLVDCLGSRMSFRYEYKSSAWPHQIKVEKSLHLGAPPSQLVTFIGGKNAAPLEDKVLDVDDYLNILESWYAGPVEARSEIVQALGGNYNPALFDATSIQSRLKAIAGF
jgi:hypothetical protein